MSSILYPGQPASHFYNVCFVEIRYVMKSGLDREGCGKSPEFPCGSLLYALQQVNRTSTTEIHIVTDKSLSVGQQEAVSTYLILQFRTDSI